MWTEQTKEDIRWFEMRGTEIREVHSKITNQDYELIINFPYSYKKDTSKRYLVVYFCDGFYDFALLSIYVNKNTDSTGSTGTLYFDDIKVVPLAQE